MILTYEPATESDIPAICAFCKELIDTYEDISQIDYEKVLQWVQRKITRNIGQYTCVKKAGETVAYFSFQPSDGEMELDDLYVLPPFRNQGIGTEILNFCIHSTEKPIFLYVFRKNEGAVRLYNRLGFAESQAVGQTRLIMRRDVDSRN